MTENIANSHLCRPVLEEFTYGAVCGKSLAVWWFAVIIARRL